MFRKPWSYFVLCLALLIAIVPNTMALGVASAATSTNSDLEGHWAKGTFVKWLDQEWIFGYPDGSYKPDKPIKRAEFAALLNRAFGFTTPAEKLPFTDLTENHWAFKDIAIAFENKYFRGTGSKANAEQLTTRQESAVMVANALGLDLSAAADLSKYNDEALSAKWARSALAALSEKLILKGDTNGNIRPADPLTRAEAITLIEASLPYWGKAETFDQAGVYGSEASSQTIRGNVTITADGVTLVNTVITGDLLLAESIGEGDVTLKNVTVKGTVTVLGGGENSIHIENSVFVKIIVDKASGKVRIVASGTTTVQSVVVESPIKLDTTLVEDGGINLVELPKGLPANSSVDLIGQYENIRILATNLQINVPSGSIEHVEVGEGSDNNKINLGQNAKIIDLILNAIATFTGQGKIEKATVNEGAKGSQFENKPDKLEDSGQTTTPPITNPGGGGGVIVTPPAGDQTKAGLNSISIGASYSLVQRNAKQVAIGSGFNKEVLGYTVSVERNIEDKTVPISIVPESNASAIEALVIYKDQSYKRIQLTATNRTFEVNLKPKEDTHVIITITSGDGLLTKSYAIDFLYERTIQEAFNISRYASQLFGINRIFYSLYSNGVFEEGDVVEVYETSSDTNPLRTQAVESYGYLNLSMNYLSYEMQNQGSLYLKVKRNEKVIAEDSFNYDLTEMNQINDNQGTSITLLTVDEILDRVENGLISGKEPYVIHVEFDPAEWSNSPLKNAKYYELFTTSTSYIYPEILAPLKYEHVLDFNPYDYNKNLITTDAYFEGHSFGYDVVYDLFTKIIFYDKNYNPLGYVQQTIEPLAENVLPGYKIVHTVRPELNTEDRTPPKIVENLPPYVTPGDYLQISVSEASNIYVVPSVTKLEKGLDIHNLVRSGTGTGAIFVGEEKFVEISTSRLTEGDWVVVAVDRSGNLSNPLPLEVVNEENIALQFKHFGYEYNNGINMTFVSNIQNNLQSIEVLKQNILISRDAGKTYEALGENDKVQFWGNSLRITFAVPYSGDHNRIKIIANSLANENGTVMNRDWISPFFASGTVINMTSGEDIEAGDPVTFTTDRPAKVYLLPANDVGHELYNDSLVEAGKGKSVTIDQSKVGEEITILTTRLAPGRYLLYTIRGTLVPIGISLSTTLNANQIAFVNSETEQSVTISGLKPGDIVRLYMSGPDLYKKPAYEITVPTGENTVKVNDLNLNSNGGGFFFTVQEASKAESESTFVNYPVKQLMN